MTLRFVLVPDRRLEGFFVGSLPLLPPALDARALDLGEDIRRLLSSHHGNPGVRPHPQKARRIGSTAHAVVSGAEGPANDERELGKPGRGDGGDQFGAILCDAAVLVSRADHETGDVLEKDERHFSLRAQLDEVRPFERTLREQNAVVGENSDWVTENVGKSTNQGRPVEGLDSSNSDPSTNRAMISLTS